MNLYVYVSANPLSEIDPLGLYNLWNLGEDVLSFTAGLGDAVSFGGTTLLAEKLLGEVDAVTLYRTKRCSKSFKAGGWASLGLLGGGRFAYAGIAKGASMGYAAQGYTMRNAEAAWAVRNGLKRVFRLNPWSTFRIHTFESIVANTRSRASLWKL